MPRRIVLATFGSRGDLHPYIAIAQGLRDRGHEAVVATARGHAEIVKDHGVEFIATRPELPPPDRLQAEFAKVMDARGGARYFFEHLVLPSLRESVADLSLAVRGADVLITHTTVTAGPLVAELTGVPRLSAVVSPLSLFSRSDPPSLSIAPALAELPVAGKMLTRLLTQIVRRRMAPVFKPVAELRGELTLPPGAHPLFEGQHSPQGVLALFPSSFAKAQPDWPAHTVTTGFCFLAEAEGTMSRDIQQFLEAGKPPVVFTLGDSTAHDPRDFYVQSIEAVNLSGERALFVGAPTDAYPARLSRNILLTGFAPLQQVLPRAAAIVHHGGIGTVGLAIQAGIPMLVMPHSHDQPDNAARAKHLGIARVLSRRDYKAAAIARELHILTNSRSYRERSLAVRHQIGNEDGVRSACDVIEEFLKTRSLAASST